MAGCPRPIAGSDFPSWPISILGLSGSSIWFGACRRCAFKDPSGQILSAFYVFQKLTERDFKGGCQRCQVAETDLSGTSLEVRYMNLVNTRLFGKVELPPTPFLSEVPDSFARLDANIGRHSSSIDFVEALYLVDALSRGNRSKDCFLLRSCVFGPSCPSALTTREHRRDVGPFRKSYEVFNQGIAARHCGQFKEGER